MVLVRFRIPPAGLFAAKDHIKNKCLVKLVQIVTFIPEKFTANLSFQKDAKKSI